MIDKEELYRKTNDGLDIILYYYPDAAKCIGTNKPFKIREESDASAYIKKFNDCYMVTDFGENYKAQSPIDIAMKEESLSFYDALKLLAERHGVEFEGSSTTYEPKMEYRTANPDEKEGDKIIQEDPEPLTEKDYKIFGPFYNKEFRHLEKLNWIKLKSITYIKNGKATIKSSTDTYPIYARRCYYFKNDKGEFNHYAPNGSWKQEFFYKIYEPLSKNKNFRFQTANTIPPAYIHGLYELHIAYMKENEEKRKDRAEPDAPYDMQKFKSAFICAGERDAACLKGLSSKNATLDCFPIWLNSETYNLTNYNLRTIERYAERVYNIPDIDKTGVERGVLMAKRFWSIYTIWLPDWLRNSRDWRGNPKKDFRDYCELKPSFKDFEKLVNNASCVQFWREFIKNDKVEYSIRSVSARTLLETYGFGVLQNDISRDQEHIQVDGQVVKNVAYTDIYRFLDTIAQEKGLKEDIKEILMNTTKISTSTLDRLKAVEIDFTNYTKNSQLFFFKNNIIQVSHKGIQEYKEKDRYVWEKDIIDHDIKLLDDFFKITYTQDHRGNYHWDIEVTEKKCCYLNYVINTSRMFWREELEYRLYEKDSDYALQYRKENKFNIAGPLLTAEEISIQKWNLVNKIFTIGYLLHSYKGDSIAWAPFLMDGKVGDDGQCNGRSGKSLFIKILTSLIRYKRINGRENIKNDAKFLFDGVTPDTKLVYIDDADEDYPIKQFYSLITSDFHVNPKGKTPFVIPFEKAPKLAFTTNYIPFDFDSSTVARLLYVVFSDYYHERTLENGYLQNRSIRDDFGKDLMRDYTDEEWNLDYNFMFQCLKFYLKVMNELSIKIQPPMDSILARKYKQDMGGEAFEDWAFSYFSEESDNLDKIIHRNQAYESFRRSVSHTIDWKPRRFNKALKAFVKSCDYIHEMNPSDVAGANGRIQIWNPESQTSEAGFYLRSVKEYERLKEEGQEQDEEKNYDF